MSPEVSEVSLDVQVQDGGGSRGAQRRAVLAQQVLELLTDLPVKQKGELEWGGGELPSVSTEENRADSTLPSSLSCKTKNFCRTLRLLTLLPAPFSCARSSLWARCAASPNVPPPPCWETLSRRCSRSPSPGGAPHLSSKRGLIRGVRQVPYPSAIKKETHLPPGR